MPDAAGEDRLPWEMSGQACEQSVGWTCGNRGVMVKCCLSVVERMCPVSQRHHACAVADLPEGKGKECVVGERIVALFKLGEEVVAVDGICAHAGGPIAQGMLRDGVVTCPWHGWQYNVRTGQHQLNPRICLATFPVEVEDGQVYVELPEPD